MAELLGAIWESSPTITLLLGGAVAYIAWKSYKLRKLPGEPPRASYRIPIIGHGLQFVNSPGKFMAENEPKYGDTYSIMLFGNWVTIIGRTNTPEVLKAAADKFSFDDAIFEMFDAGHSGSAKAPDYFHIPMLRTRLNHHLTEMTHRAHQHVVDLIESLIPAHVKGQHRVSGTRAFTEYYPQSPHEYTPERHINAETSKIAHKVTTSSDQYVPFGRGRHICPGRFLAVTMAKFFIIHLLRNFEVTTESGRRPVNIARGTFLSLPAEEPLHFTRSKL